MESMQTSQIVTINILIITLINVNNKILCINSSNTESNNGLFVRHSANTLPTLAHFILTIILT